MPFLFISFSFFWLFNCLLYVRVRKDLAPETSCLMRIIDLHNIELLDNLRINLKFSLLEFRNHSLSKINCYVIMQHIHCFNFLFGLIKIINMRNIKKLLNECTYSLNFGDHVSRITLVFEQCLNSFPSSGNVIQISLCVLL